jgi:aryl-alcohol dehydrogenase-like predicted oxidoreductase
MSYGEGRSEELISHVIAGQRDHVFLVSKVETDLPIGSDGETMVIQSAGMTFVSMEKHYTCSGPPNGSFE